jgi:NAD(P)-dependent dehydrogenase (short-subunit alcohol dehydrogenase family)
MEWIAGKRVIVTGPTSGIGRQIALDLGARGAALVLACRDVDKGTSVANDIEQRGGRADVLHVDASSVESMQAFAEAFRQRYDRLDVLVNNAGTSQGERRESVDGIEMTFATNVLGYHVLTRELLNRLPAPPARIVLVASSFAGDLDFDDLQFTRRRYDALTAYRQSKACNRLWSWALAQRLPRGSTVNAMAPGFVPGTELSRDLPPAIREAYRTRSGRTMEQGADTAVWLATDPAVEGITSRFYSDRREIPCEFRNDAAQERLWRICEDLSSM